ncbi:MAG: transcription antitermination factor NusB [Microgenomates group bacterium]|nr:transcription antitermination factor NusB [Microgenomates group bacterium]
MDPRHRQRIITLENLFAYSFKKDIRYLPYPKDKLTDQILKNLQKIDFLISKNAQKFPLEKIAKTDLAILRLAIYELVIEAKTPYKVIINEAVELGKEFGGEKSYAFINGVLGKITNKKNE